MEHKKIIDVPATTREVTDYTACDWCKGVIPPEECYQVNEITVSHKTGSSYPDGGMGDTLLTDLCSNCFNKLVTMLKAEGCEFRTEKWDW